MKCMRGERLWRSTESGRIQLKLCLLLENPGKVTQLEVYRTGNPTLRPPQHFRHRRRAVCSAGAHYRSQATVAAACGLTSALRKRYQNADEGKKTKLRQQGALIVVATCSSQRQGRVVWMGRIT
jgi:hypothetical protein